MDLSNPVKAIIPSLEGEIYTVLARTTTPLTGSRVAELAESGSNPGIRLALARLVRQGTVTAQASGPSLLYAANRDHLLWHAIEQAVRSAEGVLLELKQRISALAAKYADPAREPQVTFALFGSVACGTSDADSDIDLLAVFPGPAMTESDEALVDEIRAEVPRWTGNVCNIYAITQAGLGDLVTREDPMVLSWRREADSFYGPQLSALLAARSKSI